MTLVNLVAFVSWPDKVGTIYQGKMVEETSKEELFKHYEGWEEEVQQLLQVSRTHFLFYHCSQILTMYRVC